MRNIIYNIKHNININKQIIDIVLIINNKEIEYIKVYYTNDTTKEQLKEIRSNIQLIYNKYNYNIKYELCNDNTFYDDIHYITNTNIVISIYKENIY